jgi:hypothetical protein
MKMVKSLILGSAAGLVAMSGAQAADLPVKAKAVEYVRICSLYGAGFYYIPGTDTCIKLGGYLRADVTLNGGGAYNAPSWISYTAGNGAAEINRSRNEFIARSREDLNIDTRTATEYGVVRTFFDATFSFSTGDTIAGGDAVGIYFAFVQFAGFTFGKAASQYSTPWFAYPGNQGSYLIGAQSDETGVNQIAYTAQFGGGVSASISAEDPTAYDQSQLINTTLNMTAANQSGIVAGIPTLPAALGAGGYGGTVMPDIIGQVRVDQAWGLFQLSAALHDIHSLYYGTNETTGHPNDAYGGAVQAALSIKNIPTGAGDTINMSAGYANGAARYVIGGVQPNGFSLLGGTSVLGAFQKLSYATVSDGIFGLGTSIAKTNTFGFQGAFTHNWNPYWATAIFGGYAGQRYGSTGTALYCAGMAGAIAGQGVTYTCNPNYDLSQIGSYTSWTPVKNLTFSAEVMYSYIKQNMSGTAVISPGGLAPTATYAFGNQGTVSGLLRVQRVF